MEKDCRLAVLQVAKEKEAVETSSGKTSVRQNAAAQVVPEGSS